MSKWTDIHTFTINATNGATTTPCTTTAAHHHNHNQHHTHHYHDHFATIVKITAPAMSHNLLVQIVHGDEPGRQRLGLDTCRCLGSNQHLACESASRPRKLCHTPFKHARISDCPALGYQVWKFVARALMQCARADGAIWASSLG